MLRRTFTTTILTLSLLALPATVPVQGQIVIEAPPTLNIGQTPKIFKSPVQLQPPRMAPPNPDAQYALLIGIGKFQGRTAPNPGSAGDAIDVRQLLLNNGWRDDHIRILTDGQATVTNIRSGLEWLVNQCGPQSACVFHYSGHVKQYAAGDGDTERVDEALWSHDNRFIPDGDVARLLSRLPSAWINISGCEAAGFNDGIAGPTRLFTASSAEVEKSYEHPAWKNSIFTGLLVDQGILQGQADADGNGRVTRQEAFSFASDRAPRITRLQSRGPQHPYMAGGEALSESQAPVWMIPQPWLNLETPKRLLGPCVFGLPCPAWAAKLPTL